MSEDVSVRQVADHRAIADGWVRSQTVFTSPSVSDWYLDRIDAPTTDVDSRRVLCVVARSEPVRVTDVANALGMSISNASRVVKGLVADKLLERSTPEFDRRVSLLEVTEAGRKAFGRLDATDLTLLRQNTEGAFSMKSDTIEPDTDTEPDTDEAPTDLDDRSRPGDLDDGAGRSVLGRVDCIIGAFDDGNRVLTLNELTQRTELPKSTVHRMVEQLRRIGWLEREVSGYRVGMRLFEVGGLASRRNQLCEPAYPHLYALATTLGFAVQLAILDGTDVVYLECIPMGGFQLPTREGGRMPAYCTGLGKAMLAFDSEATAETLEQRLPRRTSRTLASASALSADLDRIRATGLAFDQQESYDGLACVAAPVRNAGRAIAAVSVTGPVSRIDLHAAAPHVRNAVEAIWIDRFHAQR